MTGKEARAAKDRLLTIVRTSAGEPAPQPRSTINREGAVNASGKDGVLGRWQLLS
jgi:hypothetical protein